MNFPDINIDAFPLLLCPLFAHNGHCLLRMSALCQKWSLLTSKYETNCFLLLMQSNQLSEIRY